jgi:hypothetical protein
VEIEGRTLNAKGDNITGELSGRWILDGFFFNLQVGPLSRIFEVKSIKKLSAMTRKEIFPATVFGNFGPKSIERLGNILTPAATTYKRHNQ